MSREYLNALWELTKRELRRKYARSYLGILWSVFYPLLRMALVVVLFTSIFNKGIDRYPAYYFIGFLLFEFYRVGTITSITTIRDNKDLIIKSAVTKESFVLSRVFTAFINMIFGVIPFIGVLIVMRVDFSLKMLMLVPVLFFLFLFVLGVSYFLSVSYVFFRDIKNIHIQLVSIIRFFIALFYSIDWVDPSVQLIIKYNPLYVFIKLSRCVVIYNTFSVGKDWLQMVLVATITFLVGRVFFELNKNKVIGKL